MIADSDAITQQPLLSQDTDSRQLSQHKNPKAVKQMAPAVAASAGFLKMSSLSYVRANIPSKFLVNIANSSDESWKILKMTCREIAKMTASPSGEPTGRPNGPGLFERYK